VNSFKSILLEVEMSKKRLSNLKVKDFDQKWMEEKARGLDISKATFLKEINLFRDVLESCKSFESILDDITDQVDQQEEKLCLKEFGAKIIETAREIRREGVRGNDDVRLATLARLALNVWLDFDALYKDAHESYGDLEKAKKENNSLRDKLNCAEEEKASLESKVVRIEKEKEIFYNQIASLKRELAETLSKITNIIEKNEFLENVISAITDGQVKEREVLVKKIKGD
jgi:chromosome segregation ATPase